MIEKLEREREAFVEAHYERVLLTARAYGYVTHYLGVEKGTGRYIVSNFFDKGTIRRFDDIHHAVDAVAQPLSYHLHYQMHGQHSSDCDFEANAQALVDLLASAVDARIAQYVCDDILEAMDIVTLEYRE